MLNIDSCEYVYFVTKSKRFCGFLFFFLTLYTYKLAYHPSSLFPFIGFDQMGALGQ